jgi:hypothetical protein
MATIMRAPTQQYELPADQAETRTQAQKGREGVSDEGEGDKREKKRMAERGGRRRIRTLMKWSRPWIPAALMAMTQGEALAFPAPEVRPAFLGETIIPMRIAPIT